MQPAPQPALPDLTPLPRDFYDRPTDLVAQELLGCLLVRREGALLRIGRIVETEAYLGPKDLACHAAKGRTPRTETLYGPPGFAYVYLIYGIYNCLNAVTRPEGTAEAVLIRAAEPLQNLFGLADGPGKLCIAFDIDRSQNRADLCGDALWIAKPDRPRGRIAKAPRVGVDYAAHWAKRLLRFYEEGNPHVSPAGGTRRKRTATVRKPRAKRTATP